MNAVERSLAPETPSKPLHALANKLQDASIPPFVRSAARVALVCTLAASAVGCVVWKDDYDSALGDLHGAQIGRAHV